MKSLKFNSGFKKGRTRLKHQLVFVITEILCSEKLQQKPPANSWYPLQCRQASSFKILLRGMFSEQKFTDLCKEVLSSPSRRYRPQKRKRGDKSHAGSTVTRGHYQPPVHVTALVPHVTTSLLPEDPLMESLSAAVSPGWFTLSTLSLVLLYLLAMDLQDWGQKSSLLNESGNGK